MTIKELEGIIKDDKREFIEKAILENANPHKIKTELKKRFNLDISYYLINKYIFQEFKKVWDDNKWQDAAEKDVSDNLINSKAKSETNGNVIINETNTDMPPCESNSDTLNEDNHLLTILKKLNQIESQYKEIKTTITSLNQKLDSHLNNHKEQIENFIKIYSSQTVKTTLNLNKEIKDEIEKLIGTRYEIKKNDSKLINTALLIALNSIRNNIK